MCALGQAEVDHTSPKTLRLLPRAESQGTGPGRKYEAADMHLMPLPLGLQGSGAAGAAGTCVRTP